MAWLAARSGWKGENGKPAIWWDDEPMWLAAAGSAETASTRHTVIDPLGRIVGNDPDASPVFGERLYDPTGADRDARRRLLDEWSDHWSQRAPLEPRRHRP